MVLIINIGIKKLYNCAYIFNNVSILIIIMKGDDK